MFYDQLKYYREDDSELATSLVDLYDAPKATIMELVKELDDVRLDPELMTEDKDTERGLRIDILQALITKKLDIDPVRYFADVVDEILTEMRKEINDLLRHKTHRHKTVLGLYTEKAVY